MKLKRKVLTYYHFFEKDKTVCTGYFKGDIYEYYRKNDSLIGFHKVEWFETKSKNFYIQ